MVRIHAGQPFYFREQLMKWHGGRYVCKGSAGQADLGTNPKVGS